MLRGAVKEGTPLGRKAQEYMDDGNLVPDDLIFGIVEERLDKDDTKNRGYVLDGFPRTREQADTLARITADKPIDQAIDLDVPTDVVLARLAGRRVCADCGANYSVTEPPKHNWDCDHCGGRVIQRADDTETAIRRRLDLYEEQTAPLIDWYSDRSLLTVVDGAGDPNTVTERLIKTVDAIKNS